MLSNLAQKRSADNTSLVAVQQSKRSRNDELVSTFKDKQLLEKQRISRTTNLFSPIMKLEGHESDIYSCEFHPEGELLGKNLIQHCISLILTQFFL